MSPDAGPALAEHALSEREKMLLGLPHDGNEDPDLVAARLRTMAYLRAYNNYPPATFTPGMPGSDYFGPDERRQILADLFGIPLEKARLVGIAPPFFCDYGTNIVFKGTAYMNFNVTILDSAKVTIGSRVLIGPSVNIYSGTHSVDVEERRAGLERAYPVTIGDDAWIGGNATLVGPCTIGNGVTVAAASVVKGDFPDNVVIGGNPARILKYLAPPSPFKEKNLE